MQRLCVFCGSSPGADPAYMGAAQAVGHALAQRGIGLVFGGGKVGLMGAAADAALASGGEVIGVIPRALAKKEVAHLSLNELLIVETMHERKALMADLADGFIALPGGIGTFEELFEAWTWAQLGMHPKPVGLLNVAGYFDQLIGFLDAAVSARFLQPKHRDILLVDTEIERLLARFVDYRPPAGEKWMDSDDI